MTRLVLVTLVALMGSSAFAQRVGVGIYDDDWNVRYDTGYDRWYDRDYYYDDYYYDDDYYYRDRVAFRTHCAPDMVKGNVAKTDMTLRRLAASPEFVNAKKFQAYVQEVAPMRNLDVKLNKYFDLLGIDARSNADVAEFLGARRPNPQWLTSLERKADLTPRQADKVVTELSSALRGGLR